MTSEQYRAYLTESIKIVAQMMYDMAEDIVGKSDCISNLTVKINFDPEVCSVPELTIERSHLPKQDQVNRDILLQNKHELTGSEIKEICDLLWDYREELLKK